MPTARSQRQNGESFSESKEPKILVLGFLFFRHACQQFLCFLLTAFEGKAVGNLSAYPFFRFCLRAVELFLSPSSSVAHAENLPGSEA